MSAPIRGHDCPGEGCSRCRLVSMEAVFDRWLAVARTERPEETEAQLRERWRGLEETRASDEPCWVVGVSPLSPYFDGHPEARGARCSKCGRAIMLRPSSFVLIEEAGFLPVCDVCAMPAFERKGWL